MSNADEVGRPDSDGPVRGRRLSSAYTHRHELWVHDAAAEEQTPYWKRVVLTTMSVIPTLYFVDFVLDVVGLRLPQFPQRLASVTLLCALVTWPVLPVMRRVLHPWLDRREG